MGPSEVYVVSTAGHVDHGKSRLVRALTGHDPDRLEDEQRRGLSIELGYCWTDLPGVGEVAFVDVPGHLRFISTTLSGLGPVSVTMFVVAADDPWMPQAAEHLAALDALGVEHGVVVVTRADLTDPGPALQRARQELADTSLRNAPTCVVSGRTGAGLGELRATLAAVLQGITPPDADADVRFWVDRRFAVRGVGTVVTGTLPAGTISTGDTLVWSGSPVRVRGMESLGRTVHSARGTARVALNLGGQPPSGLGPGSVLVTPEAFLATSTVDVEVLGDGRIPERPVLHFGSGSAMVRAREFTSSLARLSLPEALPLRIGDRGILRDPGSRTIWGMRVLDPIPPTLTRRGSAAIRAEKLARTDGSISSELSARSVVRRSVLRQIGVLATQPPTGALASGDWLVSETQAAIWRQQLTDLVEDTSSSLEPGVSVPELVRTLGLPDPALVSSLLESPLTLEQGRVVPQAPEELPEPLRLAVAALREELATDPFRAPDAARLRDIGLDTRTAAALHRSGHVLRLVDGVVLLAGADDAAVEILGQLPQPFSVSQARQSLDTSRRVVLPLLAHLERTGRTLRLPDDRRCIRTS